MQTGLILSQSDVKTVLARHFGVPEENVINSKYSYIIVGADNEKTNSSTEQYEEK